MSRILVDTHALLWFVFDDPRLSKHAATVLADPDVGKVVSIASLWEVAVKVSLGKLDLGMEVDGFLSTQIESREVEVLGIRRPHLVALARLPFHHRDPFDRLLVAQAEIEVLPVVTVDPRFAAYGVEVVW